MDGQRESDAYEPTRHKHRCAQKLMHDLVLCISKVPIELPKCTCNCCADFSRRLHGLLGPTTINPASAMILDIDIL